MRRRQPRGFDQPIIGADNEMSGDRLTARLLPVDIPRDLEDCLFMLKTLDMIEGKKLDNRTKLQGCIQYLKDLLKGETR